MMVKVYPEELPNRVRSDPGKRAEVKLYDLLSQQLHGNWLLVYNVEWLGLTTTDGAPRDGETDFIVAHPDYGILLIEVKGGAISYNGSQRQWTSTDRNDIVHYIDPFKQVIRCKYALLNKIKSLPGWSDHWVNLGHAVAFPDGSIRGLTLPLEAPAEIIIDRHDLSNIAERITKIMEYWRGKELRPTQFGDRLIANLEKILAPTIKLPNPLSLQLEEDEQEILRLTSDQFRILNLLRRVRRAAISGCAGAGKTMLAVEKAKRLAQEGFRTLLTCYNQSLAQHLGEVTKGIDNLTTYTFSQLCFYMAAEAGITLPTFAEKEKEQFCGEEYADALSHAIALRPDLAYDAIIVDEGQDFGDTWWIALEECLKEGHQSIFYIFYDDNQRVYPDRGSIPSDLQNIPLEENVRNTRTIHQALVTYYRGNLQSHACGPVGRSVETHLCTRQEELQKNLQHILRKLLFIERIAPKNIVVLTPKPLEHSALSKLHIDGGIKLVQQYGKSPQEVLYATIQNFKGLERPVVIVVELDEELLKKPAEQDALCYVAFSRPRNHLLLVGKPEVIQSILPKA